jgi:hypothetical protein
MVMTMNRASNVGDKVGDKGRFSEAGDVVVEVSYYYFIRLGVVSFFF